MIDLAAFNEGVRAAQIELHEVLTITAVAEIEEQQLTGAQRAAVESHLRRALDSLKQPYTDVHNAEPGRARIIAGLYASELAMSQARQRHAAG